MKQSFSRFLFFLILMMSVTIPAFALKLKNLRSGFSWNLNLPDEQICLSYPLQPLGYERCPLSSLKQDPCFLKNVVLIAQGQIQRDGYNILFTVANIRNSKADLINKEIAGSFFKDYFQFMQITPKKVTASVTMIHGQPFYRFDGTDQLRRILYYFSGKERNHFVLFEFTPDKKFEKDALTLIGKILQTIEVPIFRSNKSLIKMIIENPPILIEIIKISPLILKETPLFLIPFGIFIFILVFLIGKLNKFACSFFKKSFSTRSKLKTFVANRAESAQESIFFQVGIPKFILLTILTFGVYQYYWFYKHWKFVNKISEGRIWPVPFTLFFHILSYFLLDQINQYIKMKGDKPIRMIGLLASLVFIWIFIRQILDRLIISLNLESLYFILPWIIVFIIVTSVVNLLPAQLAVNRLNAKYAPKAPRNNEFTWMNVACLSGILSIFLVFLSV